jgi:sugar lactone lactonase YvrE
VYHEQTRRFIIADTFNHCIWQVNKDGKMSIFAGSVRGCVDGPFEVARFDTPAGLCVRSDGRIFLCDYGNQSVRALDIISHTVITHLRGGITTLGLPRIVCYPTNLCFDSTEENIYLLETRYYSGLHYLTVFFFLETISS